MRSNSSSRRRQRVKSSRLPLLCYMALTPSFRSTGAVIDGPPSQVQHSRIHASLGSSGSPIVSGPNGYIDPSVDRASSWVGLEVRSHQCFSSNFHQVERAGGQVIARSPGPFRVAGTIPIGKKDPSPHMASTILMARRRKRRLHFPPITSSRQLHSYKRSWRAKAPSEGVLSARYTMIRREDHTDLGQGQRVRQKIS